ncbi:TetR/AcrR family transcriptional regulator [Chitinimonas sp.]|uniref:TetR/AcrR family transcriptional regulator n=1 Tax=Chitinimonas sp. TaxID=1934313 RepID=UPI002F94A216
MRVSREKAAESRERILDTAARLFREKGFDGIGVADLMKAAGLTHGAFYGHFSSKEDLMAQAAERASRHAVEDMQSMVDQREDLAPLAAVAQRYLSPAHAANPGVGCVIAALGADIARQGETVRDGALAGVEASIAYMSELAPGKTEAIRREQAINQYAAMVGALVLARMSLDKPLACEILQTVSKNLSAAAGPAQ